ncbi:uncharacterized protein LOC111614818 [Centruroides sculpturatus]|uniref:uncharacterized protein LOC111614818 n=1 Tax=Centruroides sculpturatus TaxID=218467 RepID=UPI000C6DFCF3|nr:uncharacterized protein LOC111614818 [Centruroides sculpturatus]
MAFSSDGSKVASTHGDHKIYVCDVRKGTLLHTLVGHPRTPWCVAFHPSSNDILASGCLGGEVRVWDLHGGSEVWVTEHSAVITSLAFHPLDKVLVIATFNEIHFWDWSHSKPFAICKTASDKEKVRFVKFDPLGNKLITGISNLPTDPFRNRAFDSVGGQEVSCLPATRGILSQRRNILSRLMSMYRHLEGLEEISHLQENRTFAFSPIHEDALNQARDYVQEITAQNQQAANATHNSEQVLSIPQNDSQPSTSGYQTVNTNTISDSENQTQNREYSLEEENHSSDFWTAFHRLRTVCYHLERHVQQQQRVQNWVESGVISNSDIVAAGSVEAGREEVASRLARFSTEEGRINYWEETQDVSISLVSLLTRLQYSLQNLNNAAFTNAFAQEQIQQVHVRISEILERLTNVSGYRARLTNLRDQIYEAAERMVQGGEDSSIAHRWDLAHCLWLVEMSLQLTRQMQRILAADYRLTHLHVSATANPPPIQPQSGFSAYPQNAESVISNDSNRNNSDVLNNRVFMSTQSSFDNSCESESQTYEFNRVLNLTNKKNCQSNQSSENSSVMTETTTSPQENKKCISSENIISNNMKTSSFEPINNQSKSVINKLQNNSENLNKEGSNNIDFNSDISLPSTSGVSLFLNNTSKMQESQRNSFVENSSTTPSVLPEDSSDSSSDEISDRHQNNFNRQSSTHHKKINSPNLRQGRRNLIIPEVQIEPSSPEESLTPPPSRERPRSPPLPTILSGNGPPLPTWGRISPYLSLFYDTGFRSRMGSFIGIHETAHHITHRIQSWDFSKCQMPCIRNANWNVVVPKCKIHNDASVDISRDGQLLAALIPTTNGLRHAVTLSIYSLQSHSLGQCLYTWKFGPTVISVSLSPLGRYIIVGLGSSRLYLSSAERETVAQIFKLESNNKCNTLLHVRNLSQQGLGQQLQVSLNSVRWLPQPGQGLIYGTNRGCLCICRPATPLDKEQILLENPPVGQTTSSPGESVQQTSQVPSMLSTATQTIHPQTHTTGTQTAINSNPLVDVNEV